MKLTVKRQEKYSRGELLLRTFFGIFYIALPHIILLYIYSIWAGILQFLNFFYLLITGKYSRRTFDASVGLVRWQTRLGSSMLNLVDGYPPFGPSARWEKADFEIAYPEVVTRKRYLFAVFLSWLVLIPHFIVIYFYGIAVFFVAVIAWFVVLFTGDYPASMHKFVVGYYRWSMRTSMYMLALYFKYPEFNGEEVEADKLHS